MSRCHPRPTSLAYRRTVGLGGVEIEASTASDQFACSGGSDLRSDGGTGAGKRFGEGVKEDVRTGECVFCGKPTTRGRGPSQSNIDHAVPKSRGGNNSAENAQEACRTCNLEKGTQTTEEYLHWSPLQEMACSYEGKSSNLLAVDVPGSTDIHRVYALLQEGEKGEVWDFEEAHCGHLV